MQQSVTRLALATRIGNHFAIGVAIGKRLFDFLLATVPACGAVGGFWCTASNHLAVLNRRGHRRGDWKQVLSIRPYPYLEGQR